MRRWVVGAGVAVLGYWALMFVVQRRLLFPAPTGARIGPSIAGMVATSLPSDDGAVPLWWLPALADTGRAPALLFFHGNGERAEDWLTEFEPVRRAGIGVAVVEYPGYGTAPGQPSQDALVAAARRARAWVEQQPGVDASRVVLYGRSLGGGVAAQLAGERAPAVLVLESTFRSVRRLAGERGVLPWLVRDPFPSEAALAGSATPTLVMHGLQDDLVPPSHGRALAAAVRGGTFVGLPCGHDDCPSSWVTIEAFLQRHGVLRNAMPHAGH